MKVELRVVYKKPLFRKVGDGFVPDNTIMDAMGEIILESVRKEAMRDMALARSMAGTRGQPVGLPDTPSFLKSFGFSVQNSQIKIDSTWPLINQHLEGRDAYPMTWLTQASGIKTVPMILASGITIIRAAPLSKESAWIHPGFIKYTFLERGVRKGRQQAINMVIAKHGGDLFMMAIQTGL